MLETLYPATRRDFLTARLEMVDKDELFATQPDIAERLARTVGSTFRIQAYTAGYTRDVATLHDVEAGIGANVTFYRVPQPIQPYYGAHPKGVNIFLRFRLKPAK
jgi:hypothetical protein